MDKFFYFSNGRNERSYGYERWCVLRNPYELSKTYYFATLTQI